MRRVWRGLVLLAGLTIPLAPVLAQALPVPEGVQARQDPQDNTGVQLLATWRAPAAPPPAGLVLAGYRVSAAEHNQPAQPQGIVRGAELLHTVVGNLKTWRKYRVGVAAIYIPNGAKLTADSEVPTAVATPGARLSAVSWTTLVAPHGEWYNPKRTNVLVFSLAYTAIVLLTIFFARRRDMYVRPIAGLRAVDDAIGRATEMGRPILYIAGLSGIGDISTIAAMLILGHLAKRTAAYETPIIVPCQDPLVLAVQREIVHEAYVEAGKPEAFNPDNIFYVTDSQFGYVAAVDGIMMRQRPAANFFMGYFYAESLILAETGNSTGAIQIAGTDADTQLPFFITSCDYTLMGEELYAASAYLSRDPVLLAQLKGQDLGKLALFLVLIAGAVVMFFTTGAAAWFLKLFEVR